MTALYAQVGTALPLSLDLNDADPLEAADAVVDAASAFGPAAIDELLLCHGDRRALERLRRRYAAVHLVHSTAMRYLPSARGARAPARRRGNRGHQPPLGGLGDRRRGGGGRDR